MPGPNDPIVGTPIDDPAYPALQQRLDSSVSPAPQAAPSPPPASLGPAVSLATEPPTDGIEPISQKDYEVGKHVQSNRGWSGDLKVGAWHALDELGLGIPEHIASAFSSDLDKAKDKALDDDHEAAKYVGMGVGIIGNAVATGGIGEALGAGRLAARAGLAVGTEGGLAAKLASSMTKTALLEAPRTVVNIAAQDPKEAGENFALAVGLGALGTVAGHGLAAVASKSDGIVSKGVQKYNDFAEQSKGIIGKYTENKVVSSELNSAVKSAGGAQQFNKFAIEQGIFADGVDSLSKANELTAGYQKAASLAKAAGDVAAETEALGNLKKIKGVTKFINMTDELSDLPGMGNIVQSLGKAGMYSAFGTVLHGIPLVGSIASFGANARALAATKEVRQAAATFIGRKISSAVQTVAADEIQSAMSAGIKSLTKGIPYVAPTTVDVISKIAHGGEDTIDDLIQATSQPIPEKNLEVSGAYKLLQPEAVTAFKEHANTVQSYLNSIAPRNPNAIDPLDPTAAKDWHPTRQQSQDFGEKLSIVNDPSSVFDRIKDGTLNKNHMEALQLCYPGYTRKLQQEISTELADPKNGDIRKFLKTRRFQLALIQGGINTSPSYIPKPDPTDGSKGVKDYGKAGLQKSVLQNGLAPTSTLDEIQK